ncbi:MAG: glutamate-1-semialdehyde 2,1-aminomutase [Candidatus Omnitrophica bacterium]|nr:glutamate-1-semialdehyde 2,1-aminomutase [Candidatus Omnitrophota bacterium]
MTNAACWRKARRVLAGGVNSPVRSFSAVGSSPFFVDRGEGPYLWDVEGKRYLDYVGSWGALILGHRHPAVMRAVAGALRNGTCFGTPTPQETALAEAITGAFPSMEQVRFVSSGTEAVMSAIRLARAKTSRSKVLKFEGAYHGHADSLLARAGSGMFTLGLPSSPGVPLHVAADTISVSFNGLKGVAEAVRRHRREIACLIVEPVMANSGLIPPEPGFLEGLRRLTREEGIVLIFDEVITGFRLCYGGAQKLYGVEPDLTVLGKAIGGGFPVGAYGGGRKLMGLLSPAGPVYQAGTLSGHPVAMAAGLATLEALRRPGVYRRLNERAGQLKKGLLALSQRAGVPAAVHQTGGLLTLFFSKAAPRNAAQAKRSDSRRYARYFRRMLKEGVYLPPSSFEAWFISAAHGRRQIDETLAAHRAALRGL